eukprot:m.25327 g.25327  ORF g.25327 m.25327 type:complete len:98 (+) comp4226_c0_seq1:4441-4734(+)
MPGAMRRTPTLHCRPTGWTRLPHRAPEPGRAILHPALARSSSLHLVRCVVCDGLPHMRRDLRLCEAPRQVLPSLQDGDHAVPTAMPPPLLPTCCHAS